MAGISSEAFSRSGADAIFGTFRRDAPVLHWDLRTPARFDGNRGAHLDEVCPRNTWVLLLDFFHVPLGLIESCISTKAQLRLEANGAIGASARGESLDALVIRA